MLSRFTPLPENQQDIEYELLPRHVPKVHKFPQGFVALHYNKLICLVVLKRRITRKAQIRAVNMQQLRQNSFDSMTGIGIPGGGCTLPGNPLSIRILVPSPV
jgi:hypothetical protein